MTHGIWLLPAAGHCGGERNAELARCWTDTAAHPGLGLAQARAGHRVLVFSLIFNLCAGGVQ
jgi:hypothetical protein